MTSLIKVSYAGPLGSLVGFEGVARLDQINSPCLSKSSQEQV